MSYLPTTKKNDIISKPNNYKGYIYERSQYSKKSLPRAGYQSVGISSKIRSRNISSFRMEKWENTKNGSISIRVNVRKQKTTKTATKNKRNLGNNSENKINNMFFSIKTKKTLDFFRFLEYDPIVLNGAKGFKMKKIDLQRTATVETITNLEMKLLGVQGILDAFSASLNVGLTNPEEALAILRDLISDTIIDKDIKMLKDSVGYMFDICSSLYHDGEVA